MKRLKIERLVLTKACPRPERRQRVPAGIAALMLLAGCVFGLTPILANAPAPGSATSVGAPDNGVVRFRGNAYDLKTGRFIYSENHAEHWKNGVHVFSTVTYRGPNEEVIANKRVDFTKSRSRPDFRLEDRRSGYVEGSELVRGSDFRFFTRRKNGDELRQQLVSMSGPAVIDGGFDYYVRENFERLLRGERQTVGFGVSARLTYFAFTIQKVGERPEKQEVDFQFAPANIVLRQLVDPLLVTYHRQTRRLLVYRGISNIESQSGDNYRARIVFQYPQSVAGR